MKILDIVVSKEPFDMIEAGIKKEEYREDKPYWIKRLVTLVYDGLKFSYKPKHFDYVQFRNGYKKDARKLLIEYKGIDIGKPNPDWTVGLFDGKKDVFRIKLGEIIK